MNLLSLHIVLDNSIFYTGLKYRKHMIISMLHFLLFLSSLPDSCQLPCHKRGKSTWWNLKTFMLRSHHLCDVLVDQALVILAFSLVLQHVQGICIFIMAFFFFSLCKFHEISWIVYSCIYCLGQHWIILNSHIYF